jgi:hypothetical protein
VSKPTIEKLREALQRIHHVATTGSGAYMSIPADPRNDADLLLSAALEELEAYRARDREQLNTIRRASGFALLEGPL